MTDERDSERQGDPDHERLVIRQDAASGLRYIVAVHSTVLGPALGGLRLRAYPAGLRAAVDDALALARTMSLKAAAAGLDLGGGKSVLIDDGRGDLRERRLELAAETINELAGSYIAAEDIGTTTADMDLLSRHTRWVVGCSCQNGGGGDPSPVTAETVLRAIRHGLASACGSDDLDGRRVGVVGVGKVGGILARKLASQGARVVVCDLRAERARRFAEECGGEVAPSVPALLTRELDVLAPCAAGGMIDRSRARSIDVRVIAGAANNPLTAPAVARQLAARDIVYVPDFLANCGGLIHCAGEWEGSNRLEQDRIARAMERLEHALAAARAERSTPLEVAEREALHRIENARAALAAAA